MREIDIHEAATSLDAVVEGLRPGEEIALTRDGSCVAMLSAAPRRHAIRLGLAEGLFKVPDDFDAPLPDDLLDLFYNGPLFPDEPAQLSSPPSKPRRGKPRR